MPVILPPDKLISMKEAQKTILSSFKYQTKTRHISTKDAAGHILDEQVTSLRTMPPLLLTGPDGIAVRSEETIRATPENPVEVTGVRVNTGLPVPEGYDAVIPIEEVRMIEPDRYSIQNAAVPMQNLILPGTDVMSGETIIQSGHYLTPYDVAALLNYGVRTLSVKSWKIGIIPTGDEVIPPTEEPIPGQIVDTNTLMLTGYLNGYKVLSEPYPITPDDPEKLSEQIASASRECDIVLLFGGSSAGTKDYTAEAIEKSGDLLFHGVAMGPGKPVSCGSVFGKPVIGLPGPSVACLITFFQLVLPLLKSWGVPIPARKIVTGEITETILPYDGWDVFYMVNVKKDGGKIQIVPMQRRFGPMMGIRADAILHVRSGSVGYKQGEGVPVSVIR